MKKKNEDLFQQAQDTATGTEGDIANSVPFNDFESQNQIKKNHKGYLRLKVHKTKGGEETYDWDQISNFHLNVVRVERLVDEEFQTVQTVLEIVNPQTGYRVEFIAQPGNLVGENNFTKCVRAQGRFSFKGSPDDIKTLLAMLDEQPAPEVKLKNITGYVKNIGHWILGNCAVTKDGRVILQEKEGGVPIDGLNYRLAANEKDSAIMRVPMIHTGMDPVKAKGLLRKVISNTIELWGPGAETAWAWALSHLWRTEWLAKSAQFPLLFVIGTPSLGKTQFIKLMVLRFYGLSYEPLPIKGASEVGIYNLINQMCNIPVFLDEYKGEVVNNKETLEFLKGNADGSAKIVGSLSQFKTKSRPQRTGLIICGETRPNNEALDSRAINCDLVKKENVALYDETVHLCENLSGALLPVLQQWEALWPLIWDRKEVLIKQWRIDSPKTDSRIVLNYARICSAMDVILPDDDRARRFLEFMKVKGEETQEKNELAKMIHLMPYLIAAKRVPIPYKLGHKKSKTCLAVQATNLILAYAEYTHTTAQSPKELIRYGVHSGLLVKNHPAELIGVSIRDDSQGRTAKTYRCFLFDMNNEIVKAVVEQLSAGTLDEIDDLQPEPENAGDPFLLQ